MIDQQKCLRYPLDLILGLGLGLFTAFWYAWFGFQVFLIGIWLISLLLVGRYFARSASKGQLSRTVSPVPWRVELICLGILLLCFTPLYLLNTANSPYQINADEIAITRMARSTIEPGIADLFSLMPEYYLLLSFVITKAPNYTRLLVILPFVLYLTLEGIQISVSALLNIAQKTRSVFGGWVSPVLSASIAIRHDS